MKKKTEELGAKADRTAKGMIYHLWGSFTILFSVVVANMALVTIDAKLLGIDITGLTSHWGSMLHYFLPMLVGAVILKIAEKIFF